VQTGKPSSIQPTPRSTQPFIPLGRVKRVQPGVRIKHFHLCQVAGNTVRSHMAGDTT